MKDLTLVAAEENVMTTKELAETLGVSIETVRTTAKRIIDPSKSIWRVINGGKSQVFNEAQATAIKIELQNHSKVARNGFDTLSISNDLEAWELQKRLDAYKDRRIAELTAENNQKQAIIDRIANGKGCYSNSQAAKALQLPYGRNTFIAKLKEKRIYMGSGEPYQDQVNAGHFVVKNKVCSDGTNRPVSLVTGKGLVYLSKQFGWKIDGSVAPDAE